MVEVFRTNIDTEKKASFILKALEAAYPNCKINFDLEDCDNILRVENPNGKIDPEPIMSFITIYGYKIEILPDMLAAKPMLSK